MRRGRAWVGGGDRDSEQSDLCSTPVLCQGRRWWRARWVRALWDLFSLHPGDVSAVSPVSFRKSKKKTPTPHNILSAPSEGDLSTSAVLRSMRGDLDANLGGSFRWGWAGSSCPQTTAGRVGLLTFIP